MSAVSTPSHSRSFTSSILEPLRNRDPEAWDLFVDIWTRVVYGWCLNKHVDRADIPDVVHDVLIQVLEKIDGYKRRKTFRGWLWTVTRNKINDALRKKEGEGDVQPIVGDIEAPKTDPAEEDDEEPLVEEHDVYLVHRHLDLLRQKYPKKRWDIFDLMVKQNLNATQAAKELGMTPHSVRKAKSRFLQWLREELSDVVDFDGEN